MSVTINGSGLASGVTSVPNLATFPLGPRLDGANMPAGCVLQVVQGTTTTQVNNSTSTYADTGLTATITPKFSTSKILVIVNHPECYKSVDNAGNGIAMQIVRGSTQIAILGGSCGYTNSALVNYFSMNGCVLDSPATTSATAYKTQFKNSNNGATCAVQLDTTTSAITLMEIAQ
jgi:hypothetical protein